MSRQFATLTFPLEIFKLVMTAPKASNNVAVCLFFFIFIWVLLYLGVSTGKMSLKCWSYACADAIEPGTFGYSLEKKPVDIDYVKAIISMKPNALQILRPPYNRERGNDLKVSYKLV